MGVGLAIFVGCCGIWIIVCICNWCESCPLYKRRKRKEVVVNINSNQENKTGQEKNPQETNEGEKPPPKYGETKSQWGMTDIWTT